MKNIETDVLKQAEQYVTGLYESSGQANLVYHTIDHTRTVVEHVNEIAAHYDLSEKEVVILNIAAWFHDTGHLFENPATHEEKSVELVRAWLGERDMYTHLSEDIAKVIMATRIDAQPENLSQQIIKDADTYHLGTKDFKEMDKLMRKEMKLRNLNTIVMDWDKNTLALLEHHRFYTEYCQQHLDQRKQKNMEKLRERIDALHSPNSSQTLLPEEMNDTGDKKKDAPKQNGFITKGIQTMLRLTSENHMRLSEMADNKANILISVNAIIISVILTVLIRKIEVDTHLTIPTMIFLASSLGTIVLAILATRPKITQGNFTRDQILNRQTNLLFFGNFHSATLEEYKWGMSTMMRDPNYLYGSLVDDIYYLGKVLGRKYRLVRIAYNVFMIGIIASAIAFILAILLNGQSQGPTVVEGSSSPF
ncbi:MAG: Pycsar system effector family protein [Chitinophagaceae bacterium]